MVGSTVALVTVAMHEAVFPAFEHLAQPLAGEPGLRALVWDAASTGVGPPDPIWTDEDLGPWGEVLPLGGGPVLATAEGWGRLLVYDAPTAPLTHLLLARWLAEHWGAAPSVLAVAATPEDAAQAKTALMKRLTDRASFGGLPARLVGEQV